MGSVARSFAPVGVVLLVVLAGCSVLGTGTTPGGTATVQASPTSTPGATGAGGTSPTPTPTPAFETPGSDESTTVTVVGVIDGDTLRVEHQDGTEETVSLAGVRAPETGGDNDPSRYAGVPDVRAGADCLRTWGRTAAEFTRERLRGEQVRISRPGPSTDGVHAFSDGRSFNLQLLRRGYAAADDEGADAFHAAASAARDDGRGLWVCRDVETPTPRATPTATATGTPESETGLRVVEVHADGETLNDEYVVFANTGDAPLDLSGWRVKDEDGNTYTFPEGLTLGIGDRLTLHSGRASQRGSHRYWWADAEIWDDGGDTVHVYDERGQLVYEHPYS